MSSEPLVSLIIPCFNQGHFIDEAVNSIENQTYRRFEIIIVNDKSTDSFTNKHLTQLSKKYKVVVHKKNMGLPQARNTGIQLASGKYILPIDADDKIHTEYLMKAVELMESNDKIGIVYGLTEYFGDQKGIRNLPEFSLESMLIRNIIGACSMFRKQDWEKVGGFRNYMKYGFEDYDFWLYILELGREVAIIPEVMFYYRKHNTGTTNHSIASMLGDKVLYSFNKILAHHKKIYIDNLLEVIVASYNLATENENLKRIIQERENHIVLLKNELDSKGVRTHKIKRRIKKVSNSVNKILPRFPSRDDF